MTLLHIKYTTFVSCGCRVEDFFMNFHYKSMVENDMPGAWPVWTTGARVAGIIKRTTIHCYTQNMKALGLLVSEKIFWVFPIVSLWEIMTPGVGPFLTPGTWLAGFIKRTTTHCYIQSMKGLGLVVSEKKIFFYVFPMTPPGRGLYGPQGHGWQELQRGQLYIATHKI